MIPYAKLLQICNEMHIHMKTSPDSFDKLNSFTVESLGDPTLLISNAVQRQGYPFIVSGIVKHKNTYTYDLEKGGFTIE